MTRLALLGAGVGAVLLLVGSLIGLELGVENTSAGARLVTLALATCAGAAGGYFAFRSPGRTVASVTTAARAIARGDLGQRIPEPVGPIAELAHDFNTMASRLQSSFDQSVTERARIEAVLAATADGMLAIGPDAIVRYLNPAAERLLRTSAETAVGRPFIASARDYELDALVRRTIAPPRASEAQVVTFGPDRTPLRAVAVPITGGGEWSVLLVLTDLTELARIDIVRRDFVANVSHELRTPLAAARALVETMEDDPEGTAAEAGLFFGKLKQQIERMTSLVNELLDLSRIESGAMELKPEDLDLREIWEETVSLLRPALDSAEMRVHIPDQQVIVEADRSAILRICGNLLSNAARYGGHGSTVHIDFRDDGELVAMGVRDEGPGVPPQELTRVFERFFKGENGRTSQGVGLGLAIVRHLVRAHGGTVDAESPTGGGAIFTVRLPRRFVGHRVETPLTPRATRLGR